MTDIPPESFQTVARLLAEQGVERTPDDLRAAVLACLAKVRAVARRHGVRVPRGDLALMRWVQRLIDKENRDGPEA